MLALMPPGRGSLLEIGAGDGFQASILALHFDPICAVDVPPLRPASECLFPVSVYNGSQLPFPDRTFDWVFSSNVLEHITDIERFQNEIRRVLRPGGRCVHIMPSATWRLWSIVTHYLSLPMRALQRFRGDRASTIEYGSEHGRSGSKPGWRRRLRNAILVRRHGERGIALAELYLFSRWAWRRLFERCGFRVQAIAPLGLFYTGDLLLGRLLTVSKRERLARVLGSASTLYIVVPNE